MPIDESALLASLRGAPEKAGGKAASIEEIGRALGASAGDVKAALDAMLRRDAAPRDRQIKGAVTGRVEILRDRAGVPHVYATTTDNLYFGLGVAMAEDRLWQMDRLRRRALGRQAEILGAAYVASDSAHLTVGIDQISTREAGMIDPATRKIVDVFLAGINRGIEAFGKALPIEFRLLGYQPAPFDARDLVAIARGLWWSLNGRIDRLAAAETAKLMPTKALRTLFLTPEASENVILPSPATAQGGGAMQAAGSDDATGSNNWALSGARTASGETILCSDPHQPFWVPSSWYEFGLHGPEDDAAGAGHPGLPGLWWGSNGDIAFGITNNAASTRDLYTEFTKRDDPTRYRDGDTWQAFDEREVSIPVRGEAARSLTIRSTVRGPVVNALVPALEEKDDPPLSLRWVGMEHLDDLRATVGIARARNFEGFRNALRDWAIPVFNWMYADRAGNIGYQMAGRVPIRGRMYPGYRQSDEGVDRWQGYIDYDDLPSRYNPADGVLSSANQRVLPPDDKRPIYGAYSQGHRGVRLAEAFAGQKTMDREANIRLQNDVKNSRAARSLPHILRHLAGNADADVAAFAKLLSGWDYQYALDNTGPTVFETFMAMWQRTVLAVHIPPRLLDLAAQQTGLAALLLEGAEPGYFKDGTSAAVADVAKRAMADLRKRLGEDSKSWQWRRVHLAHWRHPISNDALAAGFDIGPQPVDGGSHTLRNTGGELPPNAASSGAEYRIVMDFAAPDSFLAVQNIGNSGVPGSPHYRDQFEPWLRGEYHKVELKRDRVEADRESTTVIEPG